jgi:uncharacterized protein YdiU (UPF0061 family)
MDHYEHNKVYSSIDQQGRYAFGAQPQIAQWNLARLAETLVPLMGDDEDASVRIATEAIQQFSGKITSAWREVVGAKFGFPSVGETESASIRGFLTLLQNHGVDYTSAFAALTASATGGFKTGDLAFLFKADEDFSDWFGSWKKVLQAGELDASARQMRAANPHYIPRNHLVEEAIRAGEDRLDFEPMEKLLEAVLSPFDEREGFERYALPPEPEEEVTQTFCGT